MLATKIHVNPKFTVKKTSSSHLYAKFLFSQTESRLIWLKKIHNSYFVYMSKNIIFDFFHKLLKQHILKAYKWFLFLFTFFLPLVAVIYRFRDWETRKTWKFIWKWASNWLAKQMNEARVWCQIFQLTRFFVVLLIYLLSIIIFWQTSDKSSVG